MFLTEVTLRDAEAARLIPANPYDWHRVVWTFFPGRESRDFLYRVDFNDYGLKLLILSQTAPEPPVTLPESAYRCREVPEAFLEHKRYRFQLRANPTKRACVDKKTGERTDMRVPLTTNEELLAWLCRKGEQGGFLIPNAEAWPDESCALRILLEGRREFRKKSLQRAHHSSVQFSGILEVTDTALFKKTLASGIGSAKSFGFGLLMIQPIL